MLQQFGESLEARWYREHSIKAHQRHLREISRRSKSTIKSSEHTKLVNLRKLSQEFDKQREIERENFLLFIRLNEIKERKISPREPHGPKSLNISVRRKEAEKIMNENYGYVRRFMEMPSFVSARKHIQDYELQKCYKKTISKANLHKRLEKLSSFVVKPGFLPPIELARVDSQLKLNSESQSKPDPISTNPRNPQEIEKTNEKNEILQIKIDVTTTQTIPKLDPETQNDSEINPKPLPTDSPNLQELIPSLIPNSPSSSASKPPTPTLIPLKSQP